MAAGVLIVAVVGLCVPRGAQCWARPLTVDDILAREAIGSSAFSPDGRYLVYERSRRYADHEDFSTLDPVVPSGSLRSDSVYIVELQSAGRGRPLLPTRPGVRHWLGGANEAAGFSPSGRHLLVFEIEGSRVSLLSVDVAEGRVRKLQQTPEFSDVPKLRQHAAWLSDDLVVYSALTRGQPFLPTYLRATGEGYAQAWGRSWAGREPSFAEWSTDGSDETAGGQLVIENVQSGRREVIAKGRFFNIQVSPDGQWIAAIGPSVDPAACPQGGLGILLHSVRVGHSRFVTCGVSLAAGSVMTRIRWAPDSKSFVYFGWQTQDATQGTYRVIRVSDGTQRMFSHRGVILESYGDSANLPIDFIWTGTRLMVAGRPAPSANEVGVGPLVDSDRHLGERMWYRLSVSGPPQKVPGVPREASQVVAARHSLFAIREGQLFEDSGAGWRRTALGFQPAGLTGIEDPLLQASARYIIVSGRTARGAAEAVLDSDTGALLTRREALSLDGLLSLDRSAQWEFRADEKSRSHTLKRTDGFSVEVDRINESSKDIEPPRCVQLTYDSQLGGEPISSSLFLPPTYKEGERVATIVMVYPSIVGTTCGVAYDTESLFAAHGFAVLKAATPASRQRFNVEQLWEGMPALVEDAVKEAVRQGYADADRLGVYGFSQGGHAALWVTARTRLFKATVAVNGASDNRISYFAAGALPGFPIVDLYPPVVNRNFEKPWGDVGMGHTALDRPEVYLGNSAIHFTRKIEAPVLLVNSDMDSFPRDQFKSMYAALERAGKPARLVTFWGEGHHMASPANIRAFYDLVMQWYDQHLLH
jgi:dipeptidyl aminopeptidase/acylaminoacyl peptidase